MTNIVRIPRVEEIEEEEHKEFFATVREQSDQLIYVSKDKDGQFNFGHTPLDARDLALMAWHLNKVLDHLLTVRAEAGVLGIEDEEEE